MRDDKEKGAAVRVPPPLVWFITLVVGVVLMEFVYPLGFTLPDAIRLPAGLALVGAGLAAMLGAVRQFKRSGQDPKPWMPSPEIISSGWYGYTRNPMYLGMALTCVGLGVGTANLWLVALTPVLMVVVYLTAIRHEEEYLEGKFGSSYVAYKKTVRRWL